MQLEESFELKEIITNLLWNFKDEVLNAEDDEPMYLTEQYTTNFVDSKESIYADRLIESINSFLRGELEV